jgi:hypothetical protein
MMRERNGGRILIRKSEDKVGLERAGGVWGLNTPLIAKQQCSWHKGAVH